MSGIGTRAALAFAALARVFRNPGLRRLELAWLGSTMGHWTYVVALSVYAYDQGGVTAVGVISVLRLLPAAIAAPFLATFADRFRRERVMMATDLTRAALMIGAAVTIAADGPALAVYAIVIATNMIGIVFRPAQAALLPALARDPAELSAANVAASTLDAVSTFAGPAIGGVVLAFSSVETVFAVNALWFLWSAVLLLGLRSGQGPDPAEEHSSDDRRSGFASELAEGLRAVVSDRNVCDRLCALRCPGARRRRNERTRRRRRAAACGRREAGVGWLNASLGIGGFIGGFAALVLATRRRLAGDFGLGVVLFGLPFVVIGAFVSYPVALVAFAIVGVGNSVADIAALTLFQRIVPDRVLGRVLGVLEGILFGAIGIGGLLAPVAIAVLGARGSLACRGAPSPPAHAAREPAPRCDRQDRAAPSHLQLLRGVPMLGLSARAGARVPRATATAVDAPAGTTVIREGERGDRFYVIANGEVEIAGRRFGPGESFGEIALLRDVPRTATVTAETDVELVAIERDAFLGAVTGHEPAHITAHAVAAARLGGFAPLLG